MGKLCLDRNLRRVLVAVSGGADSVALLSMLRSLQDGPQLVAAHFEHGIRGAESLGDAAFVRALCDEWEIPLAEGSADVPALARQWGMGLEQAARQARYAFLREAMRQNGCEGICLAHHLDDQAETVLMHLLRGSGLHGLSGMSPREGDLLRPLLRIRKQELYDYLEQQGIAWREDATNRVEDNPRNALRLRVMPRLQEIYPGTAQAIGRLSRIAASEDEYMEAAARDYARRAVRRLPTGFCIQAGAHEALLRRVIRQLVELSADQVERVLSVWKTGGVLALPQGMSAEVVDGRLYLLSGERPPQVCEPLSESVDCSPLGRVVVMPCESRPVRGDPWVQVLSRQAVHGAVFRTRREGDYIVPLGMKGRQKLSDYLINRKVDRPMRELTLLLCQGSEVLWVVGQGISERAKLCGGCEALRFEYTGILEIREDTNHGDVPGFVEDSV